MKFVLNIERHTIPFKKALVSRDPFDTGMLIRKYDTMPEVKG
jgi:hypothetical protein